MRVGKPVLRVITPIGAAGGLYEKWKAG